MDDNKLIKAGIVIGLMSLVSFGAYVVANSFKSTPPVAMNNDPVDFSEPAQKLQKGKRVPASSDRGAMAGRPPASGGRSYGDAPPPVELPRMDTGASGGANFPSDSVFTPDSQQQDVPLQAGGSSGGGDGGGGNERAPASAESGSGGGTSMGGIFGGLGGLFGGASGGAGGGSNTGSSDNGGGGTTPTTPAIIPAGTSAGTTGGGAFVGETQNHYKASVSIGVPLSGVSGTTTGGGGYRYQVNLSGQQAQ